MSGGREPRQDERARAVVMIAGAGENMPLSTNETFRAWWCLFSFLSSTHGVGWPAADDPAGKRDAVPR